MASLLDVIPKRRANTKRNTITITQKRWLLVVHLFFMAAWFGGGLCCLILNIIALFSTDPHLLNATYVFADTLEKTLLRGGAAGSLLTGISLAVLTQWGLLRFYWINVKEIIAVLCVVIDLIVIRWNTQTIALTAAHGLQAFTNPAYLNNRTLMFIGICLQLTSLAVVIVVSIFKPWGQRRHPADAQASALLGKRS